MNGGKHHPTTGHLQKIAQMFATLCLHRFLPHDLMAALELSKKLIIKIITIGQHHQGRVIHLFMQHHHARVEEHA